MQGYQCKHVTPYKHIMVFHMPKMLRVFSNIKQFSGQGKYNISLAVLVVFISNMACCLSAWRRTMMTPSFSSNKHNAAGEILQCEARLEIVQNGTRGFPSCERKKRQKHNDE